MDFIWHFYNFTLFQHCLPIFSVFFPMFFQRVLSPGEPCGSAPWGLRNTGAVPHFRGVSRVTWSPSWKQHELSSTCTTVVLEFSNNVQECTVVLILILESSEFMYNISQHIITCHNMSTCCVIGNISDISDISRRHFGRLSFWGRLAPCRSSECRRRDCRPSCSESASRHGVRRARDIEIRKEEI